LKPKDDSEVRGWQNARSKKVSFAEYKIKTFLNELAQGTPTPGGGSVAALAGAIGSSLAAMVARVTYGKEKYRYVWEDMQAMMVAGDRLQQAFLKMADADANAYNQVVAAIRLPKNSDDEKIKQKDALLKANQHATEVPLKTATLLVNVSGWLKMLMDKGSSNCISDVGTAAQLVRAAVHAAAYNVRFNLGSISDKAYIRMTLAQLEDIENKIDQEIGAIETKIAIALKPNETGKNR
jgi:formiminotetrahydrofolate cyclodeaminase